MKLRRLVLLAILAGMASQGEAVKAEEFTTTPESAEIAVGKGTVEQKINFIKGNLPAGRYWNHNINRPEYNVSETNAVNNEQYASNGYNGYTMDRGFAHLCYFKYHGFTISDSGRRLGNQGLQVGDLAKIGEHYVFVNGLANGTLTASEVDNNTGLIHHDTLYGVDQVVEYYTPASNAEPVNIYRVYNSNTGEHFYTADRNEAVFLAKSGWTYEGYAWTAPKQSNTPVYRLYNPNTADHHYTTDQNERDALVSYGWNDEGIGWYSDDAKGTPLFRVYNPNATSGSHHYTTDANEYNVLTRSGWTPEGMAWFGM